MEGQDVTEAFQGSGKHGRKKGELSLYQRFGTRRGGRGALIEPITDEPVRCACYFISGQIMRNYSKGECTLDTLSVAEFCAQGAP